MLHGKANAVYHCLKWWTGTNHHNTHILSNCSYVWEVHVEVRFLGGDNLLMLVFKIEKEDCEISIHLQVLRMIHLPE